MSDDSLHHLLPWFLTGTLEPSEAEAFRRHLEQCAGCREEMEFLSKVRDGADHEGSAYLSEHPPPERLVALIRGELEEADARDLRGHVALCPTCALESRWAAGDLVAGRAPGARSAAPSAPARTRLASWLPLAAAAAIFLIAVALPVFRRQDREPEIPQSYFLTGLERTAGVQILRHDGARPLVLILPVELPATAFPVSLEILDGRGEAVLRDEGVSRDLLTEGLYLSVIFPAEACEPGNYRVRISPADSSEPPTEVRFRVERP